MQRAVCREVRFPVGLITGVMNYSMLVKTILDKNKQSLICCLFLAYFVCYAVSPLSLTFNIKKNAGNEYVAYEAASSYTSLRILLLEIICAKIDERKAADQDDSTARVLIRKARVILPENVYSRFLLLGHLSFHDNMPLLVYNSSSRLSASSDEQTTLCEFYALHSGPSPPSL